MKRISCALLLGVCMLTFAVAGCGGGSSDARLSESAYKTKLAAILKQVGTAHDDLARGAGQSTSISQVQAVLRRYTRTEQRIGDEVSKLKPPANAEAANAQLGRGQRDEAAQIEALLPGLVKYKTVQEAFAYLQTVGHTKGGKEQVAAFAKLKKLGYTSNG
jgi:hypothetical protein